MALPTFFVIGAGKAGTTSLHHYLDQHPEIQMSAIKEPNFFAGPPEGRPYPLGSISDRDAYERLFDGAVPMRGEASPSYTSHPIRRGAPERIRTLVPDARLVYLVRDPVARTVSHHQHLIAIGNERRPLEDVLAQCDEPLALAQICYSLYGLQLQRYLEQFPARQLLVLDSAEFLTDRAACLRRLFGFLDVDPDFTSETFAREHFKSSERRVYPPGYDRFVGRAIAPATHWIPHDLRRSVRGWVERALFSPLQAHELSPATRASLVATFAPDVAVLRELTGMRFSSWCI